jgi:NAD(P)H-dependent flavin oxidoreductase YrpB (nitropropane dioxygenase family)
VLIYGCWANGLPNNFTKGNKMAEKTYKVVGISTFKGKERKVRYGQDLGRIKILQDNGENTDIEMYELPEPMDKVRALAYALDNNLFSLDKAVVRMQQIHTGKTAKQVIEDIKQREQEKTAKHSITAEELVALAQ